MQLDFITLYVLILLNSASFALVWAVIAVHYRTLIAARHWRNALVMTCASGPLLVLGEGGAIGHAGLALVAGSFATMWQGLRVFYGHRFNGWAVGAVLALTIATLAIGGRSQQATNLIAAISQIVPVALAASTLWQSGQRSSGNYVAITASAIVILGQGGEALGNGLQLANALSSTVYYSFGAWFLVCAIIGGSIWNLGFLLMAADRYKARLIDLATSDDLTGLMNRRGLRDNISQWEASMLQSNGRVSLMAIDLDKFKSINDRHGHAAGDAGLVHIADLVRSILREKDVFARVGGDEFYILLPNTGKAEAGRIAARINAAISARPLRWRGHDIEMSASIGVAEWRPGGALSLVDSLERADELMFGIKKESHTALALTA